MNICPAILFQTMMARWIVVVCCGGGIQAAEPSQYIIFNRAPGQGMYQGEPESLGRKAFDEVLTQFPNDPNKRVQTAISHIFSVFRTPPIHDSTPACSAISLALTPPTGLRASIGWPLAMRRLGAMP